MIPKHLIADLAKKHRRLKRTKVGAKKHQQDASQEEVAIELGALTELVGDWVSLPGHGWNMIALPFGGATNTGLNYRLLLNQYDETLNFDELGGPIPNRGISKDGGSVQEADQFLGGLQYFQQVTQIAEDDFPQSGLAGSPGDVIHEEPGLWLHMTNETTADLDIARLGTVPHGDSLLAVGTAKVHQGGPDIPSISGLPHGVNDDINSRYLTPYKHFHDNLFQGVFDPVSPNSLLVAANQGLNIVKTTELTVSTATLQAGIRNIPFIEKQADASEMQFSFWIEELDQKDSDGDPILQLQYSQLVFLDFFDSPTGAGKIRWPHVSINTLRRKDQMPPAQMPGTRPGKGKYHN